MFVNIKHIQKYLVLCWSADSTQVSETLQGSSKLSVPPLPTEQEVLL